LGADLFDQKEGAAKAAPPARARPPSLHSDTDIYRAAAELTKVVTVAAVNMRREAKPLLGRLLIDESIWMGVLVLRTNKAIAAAKLPHLEELLEQTEIVQMTLRVARETKFLTTTAYEQSMPLTVAVAKQATALRNHFASAP
jgi:hypothetical protein